MNLALNPFGKGKRPETVDDVKLCEELEGQVNEMFKVYKVFSTIAHCEGSGYDVKYKWAVNLDLVALPPPALYILSKKMDDHGEFLSRLIQVSYDNGYNDFIVHGFNCLGVMLKGRQDRYLNVTVKGNAGIFLGADIEYCDFTVEGSTSYGFAKRAYRSRFVVEANVENGLGGAESCSAEVLGDINFSSPYPRNCKLVLRKGLHVSRDILDKNEVVFR